MRGRKRRMARRAESIVFILLVLLCLVFCGVLMFLCRVGKRRSDFGEKERLI